uniref:Uncharacterized protein n=1 Tax=Magallana gigas TaxID=29159 RepID=A0A8W8MLR2_MAGGI|nr:uncharacterized protein LOC117680426 isoform X1 [Crassostrea gigas]XP_034317736.1 uncharacterized protein LOC117680426 isoform X2 [Crassostrea gigas]
MAAEELLAFLLGMLSSAVAGILTCYFFQRHKNRDHQYVHNNNGSVGPQGYKYFLNAVGLFPRLRELPVALNLLPSATYRSVLELEIIEEKDTISGLYYSRFYSKEKTKLIQDKQCFQKE